MSHLTGNIIGFFKEMPVPTAVTYRPAEDPYAIKFTFYTPEPVEWTFARDLLIEGLEVPSGTGDVRFAPAGDFVIMRISSEDPNNPAEFMFARTDIMAIVDIAETMMPRGRETEVINWDKELRVLLDGR